MTDNQSCTAGNSEKTFVSALPELGIISFGGSDREHFLQGQLTNDIRHLGNGLLTAGYLNPQGRLLTIFRLFARPDAVWAIAPKESIPSLIKRLRLYVLRSKVTVEEVPNVHAWGLTGALPAGSPEAPVFALPSAKADAAAQLQLPYGRGLAVSENAPAGEAAPAALFWAASAAAGDPFVFEATKAKYVPQAVNLELTQGVSFTKGCYTGQEIVSRVQHIGKTARRVGLFATDGEFAVAPGAEVRREGAATADTVLYGAAWQGRTLVLVQVANADLQASDLVLAEKTLHALSLPYAIPL